jgi:MFS family permease
MSGISRKNGWTLGIVSVALFMVVLDNLVVSVALPTIHRELGASIQSLEWTVNAYVLAYAVLLLTGAALGDRFGASACSCSASPCSPARRPPPRSRAAPIC